VTTVIEMHPEELFDKLSLGELSQHESERLRMHLGTCAVCRFELEARGAFDDEFRSTLPATERRAPALLPRPRRNRVRRAMIWTLAAAALFVASGALAAVVSGKAPWELVTSIAAPAGAGAGVSSATRKRTSAAPTVAVVSSEASAAANSGDPSSLPPAVPSVIQPSAALTSERPPVSLRAPTAAQDSAPTQRAASTLFADANRARANGDTGQAIQLYRSLQRQFPRSGEAELSQVTLARLFLDSGDARSALGGFDAYLGRGGRTLQAEALVGRALSLRALGRRDAEVAAWRDVLERHPRSVYARQATERLAVLGRR
jgi:TolA-binding protein